MTLKTRLAVGAFAVILTTGAAVARDSAMFPPSQEPHPVPDALRGSVENPAHEAPAPTIGELVVKHAHDNGVPVNLANAVIRIESRFNPKARNRGAFGLMQINSGTARTVGFSGSTAALLSPETNLRYGMKVLAEAYRASNGDVCRTLAFYQSGHQVRRYNHAERVYCSKARSLMAHA